MIVPFHLYFLIKRFKHLLIKLFWFWPHFYFIKIQSKNKNPKPFSSGFYIQYLAVSYSHMGKPHTTIGASAFHFWVRYGVRWDHRSIAARIIPLITFLSLSAPLSLALTTKQADNLQYFLLLFLLWVCFVFSTPKTLERCIVKPLGQLVSVSSTARTAYTPDLSTS